MVYGCGPAEAALFRDLAPRLGVRPTLTDAELTPDTVALAAGRRCVSVGHKVPITASVLQALCAAGVGHLSTRSIGVDHLDLDAAARLGLAVDNVAYSPDSVADHTLLLLLLLLRETAGVLRRVDAHDYRLPDRPGRELRDLTVGVVGTGRIGAAVLHRLRAFGGRVLAHDHRPTTSADYVSLAELLERSDVVTLHLPLTPDTHHLLDGRRIDQMRAGGLLVNTGRGPLVDTAALVAALEAGRLGGAALDVVEEEGGVFYRDCRGGPVAPPLLRLQQLPNVVLTPHTAYYTDHALRDAVEASLLSCRRFETGRRHG
jgi:D-specific alpha-keto acid dehydrogenase